MSSPARSSRPDSLREQHSEPQKVQEEQDKREARVLSKHLDSDYTGDYESPTPNDKSGGTGNGNGRDSYFDIDAPESSLKLQGGDVHRDLYRIEARGAQNRLHKRSATFSFPPRLNDDDDEGSVATGRFNEPGGFRRQYLQRQQLQSRFSLIANPATRNFVDFLQLYGEFAGEDLADTDDEDITEEDEAESQRPADENRPLLGRRMTSRRTLSERGDASELKTFSTLFKGFVGTGIMFLPRAFRNGGLLFSSVLMVSVSLITALCFHLLLQCRKRVGGGYGEIGKAIAGDKCRSLILSSVAISQIGFVCAGIIFVAENAAAFLSAVTHGDGSPVSTKALILLQLVILVPLAFIRNISKLGPVALLADVCIVFGLGYIYYYDIATLATRPGFEETVQLFNPSDFTLTIGSAIFTFEGIGLILPIQSSMKNPGNFSKLLYLVMILITIIFTSVGFFSYATFGEDTKTEIISNFPQDSKLVNAVQSLYTVAVLVGTPVQLFPALRIMEGKLFGRRSGKQSMKTKWKKNAFRTAVLIICCCIGILGAGDLDKFVSLIGSFAVSLSFLPSSQTPFLSFTCIQRVLTRLNSAFLWSTFTRRTCITRASPNRDGSRLAISR